MEQNKFKSQYKFASCSRAPWASVIEKGQRDSVMRQIRLECLQIYGYEMDTCPKKEVCLGKSCLGRELPWKSPTAKPYLDKMEQMGLLTNKEYIVQANCNNCPIKPTCTAVCPQINDFMARHTKKQPDLVLKDTLDNYVLEAPEPPSENTFISGLPLPFDCLNKASQTVVKLRMNKRTDFLTISKECSLFDQSEAYYIFYRSLTKLSEYAILRRFLKEKGSILTLGQKEILEKRYIHNKDLKDIAKDRGTSIQNIQQIIARVIKANKISWPIYVKRSGNKTVYAVPEVLR